MAIQPRKGKQRHKMSFLLTASEAAWSVALLLRQNCKGFLCQPPVKPDIREQFKAETHILRAFLGMLISYQSRSQFSEVLSFQAMLSQSFTNVRTTKLIRFWNWQSSTSINTLITSPVNYDRPISFWLCDPQESWLRLGWLFLIYSQTWASNHSYITTTILRFHVVIQPDCTRKMNNYLNCLQCVSEI